jgi:HPt (histidine-containing phosphotransfer) domain-containing protein
MGVSAPGSGTKGGPEAAPAAAAPAEPTVPLLDRKCIDEIKHLERAMGQKGLLSGFVLTLERNLEDFGAVFSDSSARGDAAGVTRPAHALKGACRQLGLLALGDLFADIEASKSHDEAKRKFDAGASLVARSIQTLKQA